MILDNVSETSFKARGDISEVEPAQIDSVIYQFLKENGYCILNDNGYLSLDVLIDENQDVFQQTFGEMVKKSLRLIFYSDSSKELSSVKKAIKEKLLCIYNGAKNLIAALSYDYQLLLNVYSVFFKYRIKIFSRNGDKIKSQIYGEKESRGRVKILYDSMLFYILVKGRVQNSEVADYSNKSPSSICKTFPSASSGCTIRVICAALASHALDNEEFKYPLFEVKMPIARSENNNLANMSADSRILNKSKMMSYQAVERSRGKSQLEFRGFSQSSQSKGKLSLDSQGFSWRKIANFNRLGTNTRLLDLSVKGQPVAVSHGLRKEAGTLLSYSASRQYGFILTDQELELIVVYDELTAAGIPEQLLQESSDNIYMRVYFTIKKLSSEPVATFKAIDMAFDNSDSL